MARSVHPVLPCNLEGVMTYDRRDWEEQQLHALKQQIADRLRSVCNAVPADEFDRLVDRMARIRRKYEQATADELLSYDWRGEHLRSS